MSIEELGKAMRDTAHILWPDEQAFIGTYRPMLVEEIVPKDGSTLLRASYLAAKV